MRQELLPREHSGSLAPRDPSPSIAFDNGVVAAFSPVEREVPVHHGDDELTALAIGALCREVATVQPSLRVWVENGTAYLEGVVEHFDQRGAAGCAVRFVPGITNVENRIVVRLAPRKDLVRAAIFDVLRQHAEHEATSIIIDDMGDRIVLRGVVSSREESRDVERAAKTVAGERCVENRLDVRDFDVA